MAHGAREVHALRRRGIGGVPSHRRPLARHQGRDLRPLPHVPQDLLSGQGPARGAGGRRPGQPDAGRAGGRSGMAEHPSEGAVAAVSDIPPLDRLLNADALRAALDTHGRTQVVAALRRDLDTQRQRALAGQLPRNDLEAPVVAARVSAALDKAAEPRLRAVYNLTGTVLHTNLGRALLPDEAVASVLRALTTPANLEFDLDTGGRGDRDDLIDELLCELTGAEAATVVNNNAAAVLLMLNALADRREVVVSRGELVIGRAHV
ncbi:hypothetical protein G6F35_013913 [Rhizopus arrhizus]|nr:hypothetical protein G6F35_013913 [Rhizopus arrhizus]